MARKRAKANKTVYTRVAPKKKKIDKKHALIIFISIFVGVVILAAGILGISVAVTNASYLIAYDGIGVSEGVANYFISYYKGDYMTLMSSTGVEGVDDTATFWATEKYKNADGTAYTYGDDMKNYALLGIRSVVAANKIFDSYAKLSSDDKEAIETSVREILDYRAQGSVKTFNENTAKYGYDYNDFKTAVTMLYKSNYAMEKICGVDGANMKNATGGELLAFCEDLFSAYSHVSLLFVRTETTFVLDEENNRVRDENNSDVLRPLTEDEKAARVERIKELKACIDGINSGDVAPERFYELMAKYDEGDSSSHSRGYYFHPYSEYTQEFSEVLEDIVSTSYTLEVGEAAAVECEVGVCFVYRLENTKDAYTDTSEDWCFADFYSVAAYEFYSDLVDEYRKNVVVKDGWGDVDAGSIPYNDGTYVARF